MRGKAGIIRVVATLAAIVFAFGAYAPIADAHCDTLDGPIVTEARTALQKGDVTPVLKWVRKEDEAEIREAFKKTLTVRAKGPEAKELADMYFFETLVRIHRAGEGAAYTGLKPAGAELNPAVVEADKALEKGDVNHLVKIVTDTVAEGIRGRFPHAAQTKKHADESVEAGREFVAAYVEFVHYAERLFTDATEHAGHRGEEATATSALHQGKAEEAGGDAGHRH